MTDFPRLIEHAFPLKQASLDSVHEKNVRHGHISTLHIWPARRPLAACRAALIATLLPDPSAEPKPAGMSDAQWEAEIKRRRKELCEKIGGRVVRRVERKKMPNGQIVERIREETEGGILHWGRETENADTLEWFRQEIRKAYGGRAPKVLDPFAGGGAIPLEAMRLGCEATAIDINPVAWFILKCTLEYPQKLAGQTRPLPDFILHDDDFMREFFAKGKGYGKPDVTAAIKRLHDRLKKKAKARPNGEQGGLPFSPTDGSEDGELQADLAWHVRAWGRWVLARARKELARFYPTYADFQPLKPGFKSYERQPMRLVPLRDDGTPDIDALNAEFTEEYLDDKRNPRWVAKPTVAYLWARTVKCKNCRATVPLLKTRWLCKKPNKRVLLTMEVVEEDAGTRGHGDAGTRESVDTGTRGHGDAETAHLTASPPLRVSATAPKQVRFGIDPHVPVRGGNAAQRREHDKRIGAGTMSRAGATCPCCGTVNTMEDIRLEGKAGRLASILTAVVVDGPEGKEYRRPTEHELAAANITEEQVQEAFRDVPFGVPEEPTPSAEALGMRIPLYGFDKWRKLFTPRQLVALGRFVSATRAAREEMAKQQVPAEWIEAVGAYLALLMDKLADRSSTQCIWISTNAEKASGSFGRFALPILWDYVEIMPSSESAGGFFGNHEHICEFLEHALLAATASAPRAVNSSATRRYEGSFDLVFTDPPYYDAIPYSDLMDFFYIWLRRSLLGLAQNVDRQISTPLSPKWDHTQNDGELIDDASRHGNDAGKSKQIYEDGMARVFEECAAALSGEGRLVIVFANKQPNAWETLVSAVIRAGFVVDGSWPIQTERSGRLRSQTSAALASSVWLVCKKRPATAKVGWDNNVLSDMRQNIMKRLREFWDAGIRGPDFVWAATGPALEAYSRHPVVKKADKPGEIMTVSEFLTHVRRMVVDFVVGRVLSGDGDAAEQAAADRLDEVTAYYLLHRHDFGMDEAPAGACILYATACGLTDGELADTWDILARTGGAHSGASADDEDASEADADDASEEDEGSGSKLKLKTWAQRKARSMGYEAPGGRPIPLIDRVHRLMHLWKAGDVHKVDEYLDDNALRRHELFKRLLQSLIELSPPGSDERSLLESLSNHVGAKGAKAGPRQAVLEDEVGAWTAEPSSQEE